MILDTPGLLNPKYPLQQAMRSTAVRALDEADVIIYLADATEGMPPSLAEAAELSAPPKAPVDHRTQQIRRADRPTARAARARRQRCACVRADR